MIENKGITFYFSFATWSCGGQCVFVRLGCDEAPHPQPSPKSHRLNATEMHFSGIPGGSQSGRQTAACYVRLWSLQQRKEMWPKVQRHLKLVSRSDTGQTLSLMFKGKKCRLTTCLGDQHQGQYKVQPSYTNDSFSISLKELFEC